MDKFVVSARKYRPNTFDTVVGQQSITTTLTNAIDTNQLAQAYLFCGPRGVGKTTCARIFAKTINLRTDETLTPDDDFSFNLFELDAASNNSVDDIRNLTDQVRVPPQRGTYKVYIIDEVHMLSQAAFNAFLKTLEEPPPHAIFILATTEKHKIIPTILSRCQIFDFHRIQIRDMVAHLQSIAANEGIVAEADGLQVIAQKADGALRDALSIFDQIVSFAGKNISYESVIENLNVLDYDYYFKVTDGVLTGNMAQVLLLFDEILTKGFDGHNFINGLAEHFRNLLVCKDPATLSLLEVGENTQARYRQQAATSGQDLLLEGLKITAKTDVQYKGSKNQRLLVEIALLQLCSLAAGGEKKNEQPPGLKPPQPAEKRQEQVAKPVAAPTVEAVPTPQPVASTPPVAQEAPPAPAPTPTPTPTSVAPEAPPKVEAPAPAPPPAFETPPSAATPSPPPSPPLGDAPPPVKRSGRQRLHRSTASISMNNRTDNATSGDDLQAEEPDPNSIIDPSKPQQLISESVLQEAWEDYANILGQNGNMSLSSLMTARKPHLRNDTLLVIQIDSSHAEPIIHKGKSELLAYLREKVNNYALQLEHELVKTPIERKAYTSDEKFKKMAEKNPNLETLRQRLDLDIER